jgi:hypothetical protein
MGPSNQVFNNNINSGNKIQNKNNNEIEESEKKNNNSTHNYLNVNQLGHHKENL